MTIDGVLLKDSRAQLGNGTSAAPSYSFSGDLDNGLYLIGADNPGIVCGANTIYSFKEISNVAHTLAVRGILVADFDAATNTLGSGSTSGQVVGKTIAANTLTAADVNAIRVFARGRKTNTAAVVTLYLRLNGQQLYGITTTSASQDGWVIEAFITYVGATDCNVKATGHTGVNDQVALSGTDSLSGTVAVFQVGSLDWTADQTLEVFVTVKHTSDSVIADVFMVELIPSVG